MRVRTVSWTTLKYSARCSSITSSWCCRSLRNTKYGSLALSSSNASPVSGSDNAELIFLLPRNRRWLLATDTDSMSPAREILSLSPLTTEYFFIFSAFTSLLERKRPGLDWFSCQSTWMTTKNNSVLKYRSKLLDKKPVFPNDFACVVGGKQLSSKWSH